MSAGSHRHADAAPEPVNRRKVSFPARALLERVVGRELPQAPLPWGGYLPESMSRPEPTEEERALVRSVSSSAPVGDGVPYGLAGRVWSLSRQPKGCREVQRALDEASTNADRQALVAELRGHVRAASRCPHATHVIQKCIAVMRPHDVQFMIDELADAGLLTIALHKHGCRVLQRLLEYGMEEQLEGITRALLADFEQISKHHYGKFVMMHILEYGSQENRQLLMDLVKRDIQALSAHPHGSTVVCAALLHGDPEDTGQLVEVLQEDAKLSGVLSHSHNSRQVLKLLLQRGKNSEGTVPRARRPSSAQASVRE